MASLVSGALLCALLFVSCLTSPTPAIDEHEAQAFLNRRLAALRQLETGRALSAPWHTYNKRSPHQIEHRAMNAFKNCYFSPIQCVLTERRK